MEAQGTGHWGIGTTGTVYSDQRQSYCSLVLYVVDRLIPVLIPLGNFSDRDVQTHIMEADKVARNILPETMRQLFCKSNRTGLTQLCMLMLHSLSVCLHCASCQHACLFYSYTADCDNCVNM